jgi:hypothetical protein
MPLNKTILRMLLLIFVLSVSAPAGVYIQIAGSVGGTENDISKMYIDKDRMRMEISSNMENEVMIFRQDQQLIWVINNKEKSYSKMTRDDLAKMKGQIDQAMKMMEEQLKNMPVEQREMMEKMMPKQGAMQMSKVEKTVYTKKKSGEKINRWTCDYYEGMVSGKKTEEVWTITWQQAGISRNDLQAFRGMGEFFQAITGKIDALYQIGSEDFEKQGGYAGLPVKMVQYEKGNTIVLSEVKEIKKQNIAPKLFELPAGFEETENPWGKGQPEM